MKNVSLSTAAAMLLMALSASGQQDCGSGPPPPSDLGVFIWVNSDFTPQGEEKVAEERLRKAEFLCQRTLGGLFPKLSLSVPISDVDFSTSCSVPLEDSCNLLSSCSRDLPIGGGRRLTQQCLPFFGCSYFGVSPPPRLPAGDSEITVLPPTIKATRSMNVALGVCFGGSCNVLVFDDQDTSGKVLGALAYGMCPEKYVKKSVNGWTALHWAAGMGTKGIQFTGLHPVKEAIQALVEKGADLEGRDADGFTPMHVASKWGVPTSLQTLIDMGADMEAEDSAGNTPLVVASVFGTNAAIRTLLEAGANPNVRYFNDEDPSLASKTPLHFASLYSRMTWVVEKLIEAGADVKSIDEAGNTPLQLAEKYGRGEVIDILKKNGAR